ncbi:MAG TPA: hypothetical protein VIV58_22085 [Kofleriaceae bacterium]
MKLSHPIFDVAGALAVVWLWTAIYESFTRTGVWRLIDDAVGNVRGMAAEAAVLGACVLAGWFAFFAGAWLLWWLFARHPRADDFPTAAILRH